MGEGRNQERVGGKHCKTTTTPFLELLYNDSFLGVAIYTTTTPFLELLYNNVLSTVNYIMSITIPVHHLYKVSPN